MSSAVRAALRSKSRYRVTGADRHARCTTGGMEMPPVSQFMTPNPYAVASDEDLSTARSLMQLNRIHHLPVVDDDVLVGILCDRDLLPYVSNDRVCDVMTRDVATVSSNAPLGEVLNLMDAGRIGSVVITGELGIEGIFTVTDALRVFAQFLLDGRIICDDSRSRRVAARR
jgi:CBS domain-containing protein